MPIPLTCGGCGAKYQVPDNMAGRPVKCKCGVSLQVPGAPAPRPAAAAKAVGAPAVGAGPARGVATAPAGPRAAAPARGGADPLASLFPPELKPFGPPSFAEQEVPEKLQNKITSELWQGERILWLGRPSLQTPQGGSNLGAVFTLSAIGISVGLAAIAASFFTTAVPPFALWIVGGFFLLFGLTPLILVPLMAGKSHLRDCYVLTNRRTLIASYWYSSLQSFNAVDLAKKMKRQESEQHPDSGNLVMGVMQHETHGSHNRHGIAQSRVQEIDVGFMHIDHLRAVEALVRKVLLDPVVNALLGTPAGAAAGSAGPGEELQEAGSLPPGPRTEVPSEELPANVQRAVEAELKPGERLLWTGRGRAGVAFRRNLGFYVPFLFGMGFVVTGAVTWFLGIDPQQQGEFLKQLLEIAQLSVFTLPILLILALAPFYYAWRATKSCYALTNKRAIVVQNKLFGPKVEVYLPSELMGLRRSDSWLSRGAGDLIFRSDVKLERTEYYGQQTGRRLGSSETLKITNHGFLNVPEVKRLEQLVRETLVDRFMNKLYAEGGA